MSTSLEIVTILFLSPSCRSYSQPKPTPSTSKVTGPVNGDECYFWRTSGCAFGDKCKYAHVPGNKAVDLKKVEAKYGGRLRLQNPNVKS